MTDKVIFLSTIGLNSWDVPADWNNAAFSIECLGPGGNGENSTGGHFGAAGGGGAWSKITQADGFTLTPRGTAAYRIGAGGSAIDAWISNTGIAPTTVAQGCLAKAGASGNNGTGGIGGASASCIGSTKFSGGAGANGGAAGNAGAGGAAGPGGKGGDGANVNFKGGGGGAGASAAAAGTNATNETGGTGAGMASGGTGAGGTTAGTAGADGTGVWTSNPGGFSIGPGAGGAGGGPTSGNGGNGGGYGGGGGGCLNSTLGAGTQAVIIITYTPATTSVAQTVNRITNTNLSYRGRPPRDRFFLHGSFTMLRWRHLTSYFVYTPTAYRLSGPGETDIRQKEPVLTRLRTATLMRLRVINPSLEE